MSRKPETLLEAVEGLRAAWRRLCFAVSQDMEQRIWWYAAFAVVLLVIGFAPDDLWLGR